MLLNITLHKNQAANYQPADLGFLLHKHPDKVQEFELSYGKAHVLYPELTEQFCTASLLVEVDPINLVRSFKGPASNRQLEQYVNDRPYVANSFLSVAIAKIFRSAMAGQCQNKPELAEAKLPFTIELAALPCRGGTELLEKLFKPLGYEITAEAIGLDDQFTEWGDSHYFKVKLTNQCRLADLLSHLYVLIPVLDKDKHYWINEEEIEKLLRKGGDWLKLHPEKFLIIRRYLNFRQRYTRLAINQLTTEVAANNTADNQEEKIEKPLSLNKQRIDQVLTTLVSLPVKKVLDIGCGDGKLLKQLFNSKQFTQATGLDVSSQALAIAENRLKLDRLPEHQQARVNLLHGSLLCRDARIKDFDAICCIEVVEHVDEDRLPALEKVLFDYAKAPYIIVTTPNSEYNQRFGLEPGQVRHPDHRFEWSRQQFTEWTRLIADKYHYNVTVSGLGEVDQELGQPTQMAVFTLHE
ncbi:3' terminal RNA ribose 2'-O-methyltransferase Hen1 [Endozoicomonas sp. SM1973]|uniref:Small RNA 2'-O-methyltransferase n=1 Tax=Spartinivicinus marinus TaxID=2994442 RepID=A0A853IFK8_9GAMM|nr:3' terminal RNA ribose 2'-O-methyltransferase Hen1 [Spartinivicinus marinus]MCX4027305.1 3' terminal RNA ribose 2'-O-methyltransferase Hen1 [Spartinivicinus marinus]NYZ67935.1 3' terminal RNA ribose 2'-O-methyltransferase Hen1 [Spartinivicinus marinus]